MTFSLGHALVIGIGSYKDIPRWNVPKTVADANAVADVLGTQQFCGYPPDQVKLLIRQQASREQVLDEFKRLAVNLAEEHTLFVFYCGHGEYCDDGNYHLSTHDTRLTSTNKIESKTAISHQELIQHLQKIKAKRVLLVFNACHSGTLSPALGGSEVIGRPLPASTANALLSTGSGRIIMTACKEDQLSYIGDGPLTCFTTALVEGLRGRGDVTNHRGYISAYDIYLHTYYAVHDVSERLNLEQEPELTVLKGVGPFAVALYQGMESLGTFDDSQPIPNGGAVREVHPTRSHAAMNIMGQVGRDMISVSHSKDNGNTIEGNYKRKGDEYNVGPISGSIVNVGSKLSHSFQGIGGAVPPGSSGDELQQLVQELESVLQRMPPSPAVERVAEETKALVEAALNPDLEERAVLVPIRRSRLAQASTTLAAPHVHSIIMRIITLISQRTSID